MKNFIRTFRYIILVATITILSTSCTLAKLAKLGEQIEVLDISKISIKGSSGLEILVDLRNDSPFTIAMNNATVTLKLDGGKVATLVQMEEAKSHSHSTESIATLWKLTEVDPITLLLLAARISQKDLSNMSIDFTADLSAGKTSRTITGEDIDISKLMDDLAL